jgi:SAM-dependent methyltransferase
MTATQSNAERNGDVGQVCAMRLFLVRKLIGLRARATIARMAVCSRTIALLLQCPKCRTSGALRPCDSWIKCSQCSAAFSANAGIIDFVAGESDTALNVTAYDQQKAVSLDASLSLFRHLKRLSMGLIPDRLGTVLEIGAGTGLLTLGLVADSDFERAVVTDISPDMLAVCRARLDQNAKDKRSRITLATFSGKEQIFAPGQYDICLGSSVLHHVLDYTALLEIVRRALKSGGVAVFTEPGAPFHEALTLAMSDAIISLVASGARSEPLSLLAAWVEQTRFRLRTDPEDLAHLEDKHIFRREQLQNAASRAGFSGFSMRPLTHDPLGDHAARNYLRELGIPENTSTQFMPLYEQYAKYHFRHMSQADMSEMYLLVFTSDAKTAAPVSAT